MYLLSLATAVPPHRFTQNECWEILKQSEYAKRLSSRSLSLLRKVLTTDNGIASRQFATGNVARIFDQDVDELNETFQREAPALGANALKKALDHASLLPADLDALIVCTCTGYLCPGLSSYVSEMAGVRSDAFLQDLVGLGCGAAIPTLRAAGNFLAANPGARVAVIAVEICSAAFYLDNDPGVLISACLFSDGAAASIWQGRPGGGSKVRVHDFATVHIPEDRELLRFETYQGKLRNKLAKTVPQKAAKAVKRLFPETGAAPIDRVIAHPGGRDVLIAIQEELPRYPLDESYKVLRRHGNMSSPSVLFALSEGLETAPIHEQWLVSFGAGFSCHSCRVSPAG